ncbi:MAG: septum formation initiator family protein [Moorella sp. (in: Bacteria)]|nr:septum formation initiator family protein [Moorella sp. (in: firmicutes)]
MRRARGQSRARQRVKLLGLVLLVIALAFGRTFLAVQMVIKGYQLEGLKQEISTLQRENERLQLEVARLKSPERVAAAATNRLGMVKPGTAQLYYVPGKAVPGQQVQVAVEEPLIKGAAIAAPGRQTWLAALYRALQDWLQPVHIARVNS